MGKTYQQRNHDNWKKAKRKQKIVHTVYSFSTSDPSNPVEWYPTLHQYMDNKIHCSCPLCKCKTNNKGKHATKYSPTYNPSIRDMKQNADMLEQLAEMVYKWNN